MEIEVLNKSEQPEQSVGEEHSEHHHHHHHHHHSGSSGHRLSTRTIPSIERLRLILMLLMCIGLFGLPTLFGELVKTVCGFVPMAFFILSGYLVLHESEHRHKRILRTVKRTAIAFFAMTAVYFVINLVYYWLHGESVLSDIADIRFWIDFLVLNVWKLDVGAAIWYVQSLLYAYIIILLMDKLKILRFDWVFIILLLPLAVITGELSGLFCWNIAGHSYLPENFLTCALPYILLGGFIRRNKKLIKVRKVWYRVALFAGIALIFIESKLPELFGVPGYYNNLIGMGVLAFSVCMLTLKSKNKDKVGFEKKLKMSRRHTNCIYYFCEPVSLIIAAVGKTVGIGVINDFNSILTFALSFFLAWLVGCVSRTPLYEND